MLRIRCFLIALTCLTGLVSAATVTEDPLAGARKNFLGALAAFDRGRMTRFRQLAGQLKDYPLYAYLDYLPLRKRLASANNAEVVDFIERYPDQPLSTRLQRAWLYILAGRRSWTEFMSLYSGKQSTRLQCYHLQAKIKTGKTKGLQETALDLWLVGHSQEKACDPVFAYLDREGMIKQEHVWQRIRLAMQEGNPSLAKYLAKRLPAADRLWVNAWRDARVKPASMLVSRQLGANVPMAHEIIIYAVKRIARSDVKEAHKKWAALKPHYDFDQPASAQLERSMALSAAWRRQPQAHGWLVEVPDVAVDSKVREWRARTAIAAGLWEDLLKHIADMPPDEAQQEEWRYWEARAYEESGDTLQASDRYARLAQERDYHGFLAADRLDWPYEMGNRPLGVDPADIDTLAQTPGFTRARELYLAELWLDARREWHHAIKDLTKAQIRQAASLAHQWGWHDRAILTVARAQEYDDLVLRFPLAHKGAVDQYATSNKLDTGHIFAVIRQESAFNKDARSPAGARGLMQLMPNTGRITARKYSIPLASLHKLYEADKNISIGSTYLSQVMDDYDRNIVLASAAYNAGPHRVKRWLPDEEKQEAGRWVAMVPFNETRKYIQRVLAYAAIYDWRLERPVKKLDEHMPDIYPQAHYDKR